MLPQLGLLEMLVVMGVAVLLFGKRLPEVGRSLGKGIIEFKKGLRGVEEEFTDSSPYSRRSDESRHTTGANYSESSVPKFESPSAPSVPQMEYQPQTSQD